MSYRVFGTNGSREKTLAEGLSLSEALALRTKTMRDPLCRGYTINVESDEQAAQWANWMGTTSIPHR